MILPVFHESGILTVVVYLLRMYYLRKLMSLVPTRSLYSSCLWVLTRFFISNSLRTIDLERPSIWKGTAPKLRPPRNATLTLRNQIGVASKEKHFREGLHPPMEVHRDRRRRHTQSQAEKLHRSPPDGVTIHNKISWSSLSCRWQNHQRTQDSTKSDSFIWKHFFGHYASLEYFLFHTSVQSVILSF